MLKDSSLPAPLRALSTGQRLLVVLAAVVIGFLIFGSINQANSTNEFAVGIQTQPFFVLALLAFLAGILSFVSPCTLPVLTAYFAFAFKSGRSQIATNTLAFMLGLGTTFSLFGAVGFALGRVLLQSQQLILLVGGAAVLIFGVLSLLGKGFTGMQTTASTQPQNASVGGSYLFGLTFAVGWSSCVGPILGTVLTMAAQTTSVWNGMMLLFIYTLGLGLPLLIVSTFFGRMSRKSLFWRLLKGRGWEWDTHAFVVALVWALAIWRILVAAVEYAFRNFDVFATQQFLPAHEIGLLVVAVLGAALWVFTSPKERKTTLHLHSTQLFTGAMFILLGILMLEAQLALFNNFASTDFYIQYIAPIEDWMVALFSG
ncbi:MAG: cytochrome c biogenesis CcdA family protein [Anaerolineae bacterium]